MWSDAPIRVVVGPVGSGKSSMAPMELVRRASMQAPNRQGLRHVRYLVARGSYRELTDTTVKTWLNWLPERYFGKFSYDKMEHHITLPGIRIEVLFRSLDRPDFAQMLDSLELTGAWLNEGRHFQQAVVGRVFERTGRFPPKETGEDGRAIDASGCSHRFVLIDTNQYDDDHWLARREDDPPEGWRFFVQPPGLIEVGDGVFEANPHAENLSYLNNGPPHGNFYLNNYAANPDPVEARGSYANKRGFLIEGRPVVPEYSDNTMCNDRVVIMPQVKLWIGLDIGGGTLNPGACLVQRSPRGVLMVSHELDGQGLALERFVDELMVWLNDAAPGHLDRMSGTRGTAGDVIELIADPAGAQQDPIYKVAIFEHLRRRCGLPVRAAPTQDPQLRIDSIRAPCTRLIDGKPGLAIHPRCRVLRKGLGGAWVYKRKQVSGRHEQYREKPDKGPYSHCADSLGYALCAMGEMRQAMGRSNTRMAPVMADTGFSVWTR